MPHWQYYISITESKANLMFQNKSVENSEKERGNGINNLRQFVSDLLGGKGKIVQELLDTLPTPPIFHPIATIQVIPAWPTLDMSSTFPGSFEIPSTL